MNFPIDIVYMWVNDNDPEWRKKHSQYLNPNHCPTSQTTTAARWRNNDELRYSLRSLHLYAPWINHIYIVTDNQSPEWLNTDHPKITIIDHKQILPNDALPTFNSTAIEGGIYKIPNLSEHFLLSNDDMMLVAPVKAEDFFTQQGQPIVRLGSFNRVKIVRRGNYTRKLWHMQELVQQVTGKMIPYTPHHNIDAYRISDWQECIALFAQQWHRTAYSRFRQDDDMHRSFVGYYTIATKKGVMRKVNRRNRIKGLFNIIKAYLENVYYTDSRRIRIEKPDYWALMRKYNPLMICMNDDERASESDRRRLVVFLNQLFPQKSDFEK